MSVFSLINLKRKRVNKMSEANASGGAGATDGKWTQLNGGVGGEIDGFLKPAELDVIEGTFQGVLTGEYGDSYKIQTAEGLFAVNGCKALNDTMGMVSVGQEIRLVSAGKKKTKSGNDFIDIKVFVA